MKVHLIRKETTGQNAGARKPFTEWLTKTKKAYWERPADIQNTFQHADLLGNGSSRVVFDIGGNNYRMICKYAFGEHQIHLFVCWIGTHTQYDKLYKNEQQYTISNH